MTSTATTSGHPTDTHDMIVIHRVFRRESALLGDLIGAVDPDDTARAEVVGAYLQDYAFGLHVHHSGEDELIWPLLQARAPLAAETVARMQAQHRIVVETLTSALALLPAWQGAPGPTTAAPLVDALAEHRVAVREHLADEEANVLPVVADVVSVEEWAQLGAHFAKVTPKRKQLFFLGLILEDATDGEAAEMLSHLPAPVRLVWRWIGRRRYARQVARIRGGVSPAARC